MGMRNHEYVPIHLIERISHLKKANAYKILQLVLKNKLVVHVTKKCQNIQIIIFSLTYFILIFR